MKCEHCGYDAPERAVICPECGEILPRPKKPAAEEQAKKEPSPAAEKFSMPFLSAPADLEKADGIAAEDPKELRRAAQEKKFRRTRRIVAAAVAFVLILLAVFFARLGFAAEAREKRRRKVHQQPRNTVKSSRKAG